MERLETNICGLTLPNPLIAASGTVGFGHEISKCTDLNLIGAITLKGTTLNKRFGNATPRIAEAASGIINSVGLQNPGAKAVIKEEIPRLRAVYKGVVIANISGFFLDEYAILSSLFDSCRDIDMIELNISCPNVGGGCISFGKDPVSAAAVVGAARKNTSKPLIVKLTPNTADIREIAKACEDEGADAISLINTVSAMRIDIADRRPVLSNITGGLSGPAIFPIALSKVYEVSGRVKIPVIGMGGIESAKDVIEMMMAGASAVEIGAGFLKDPGIFKSILFKLPPLMDSLGIKNTGDIVGCAL